MPTDNAVSPEPHWDGKVKRAVETINRIAKPATDNSASLEKPDWNCECGFSQNSLFSIRCLRCEKYRPDPSSSPLETPSQLMCAKCGKTESGALHHEIVTPYFLDDISADHTFVSAESSPKPAESPDLEQRIADRVGALTWDREHAELMNSDEVRNGLIFLAEAVRDISEWITGPATPSPEPPRQTHDLRNCPAMRALESLTPGGSEYIDDIPRCVATVRERRDSVMRVLVQTKKQLNEMAPSSHSEPELVKLREALQPVANIITSNIPTWYDWDEDSGKFGVLLTKRQMQAILAALASTPQNEPEL